MKNLSNNKKLNIILFLRLILIVTFVFSVYSKMYSYSDFVNFISDLLSISLNSALILSNLLLAVELYISIYLIIDFDVFVMYFVALLLTIFSLFNLALININTIENCFCFGTFLILNPVESFFKNIVLILISIYMIRKSNFPKSSLKKILTSLAILTFSIIYFEIMISEPIDFFRDTIVPSVTKEYLRTNSNYLLIDARHNHYYKEKHLNGAINIPLDYNFSHKFIRKKIEDLIKQTSHKVIITYCDNFVCGLAKELAYNIKKAFPNLEIYYLKRGIEEWLKQ